MKRTNLIMLAVCVIVCFCASSVSALGKVQSMNLVGNGDVRVSNGQNLSQNRLSGNRTTLSPAKAASAKMNPTPGEQDPQELYELGLKAGRDKDYETAFEYFQAAAEQGHADAQYSLGDCYYYGRGVEQNYDATVKWYRLAAEQGNAKAQNSLGGCYYDGLGMEQDYAEAVKWYRLAADQGYATAQYNLGTCYETGRGVEQDYDEAVKWYRLAAEQDNEDAIKALDKLNEASVPGVSP